MRSLTGLDMSIGGTVSCKGGNAISGGLRHHAPFQSRHAASEAGKLKLVIFKFQTARQRIDHIDAAKGISIFLVALYHSNIDEFVPEAIGPMSLVRMPLFLFLAGVFFSAELPTASFLLKKGEGLLKPYFVTLVLVLLVTTLTNGDDFWMHLAGIFYGSGNTISWAPLWFLTHLFAVSCFAYVIYRFTAFERLNGLAKFCMLALSFWVGATFIKLFWGTIELPIMGAQLWGLPFTSDVLLVSSVFFMAGRELRDKVVNFSPRLSLVLLAALSFLLVISSSDAHIDLNKRNLVSPVFAVIGAASGIYLVVSLAYAGCRTRIARRILLLMGSSTLFILIFHNHLQSRVHQFLDPHFESTSGALSIAILALVLSIAIPILMDRLARSNKLTSTLYFPTYSGWLRNQGGVHPPRQSGATRP